MANPLRPGLPFNPFAWGTLFFTFWLTLITIPNIGLRETIIAWVYFGLSCILWLATFVPLLDRPLSTQTARQHIIPWLFLASVSVWVVGCVTALPMISELYQGIVLTGAILWTVAYMCILVWSYRPAWLGITTGAVMAVFLVVKGILHFPRAASQLEAWMLISIGILLFLATMLRSKIGRSFPLV